MGGEKKKEGVSCKNIDKSLGLKLSYVAMSCRNSHAETSTCVDTAGNSVWPAHVCIFLEEYPHIPTAKKSKDYVG